MGMLPSVIGRSVFSVERDPASGGGMGLKSKSGMPAVTFVIPVRHHANTPNWEILLDRLRQTAASIAGQSSACWRCVVVASTGSRIPQLPDRFELVRVDLPANAEYASADKQIFYDAVQLDKGRRVLAGMLAAGRSQHFMIVDDDDFVHRDLARFVLENAGETGWAIRSGYVWTEGGRLLFLHPRFSTVCGTCHIIRSDLYGLPENAEAADENYIRTMLGGHRKIEKLLAERGTPLAPLPFPGAVYRTGHSGSHSRSKGVLRGFVLKRRALTPPRAMFRTFRRLRLLTPKLASEFNMDRVGGQNSAQAGDGSSLATS